MSKEKELARVRRLIDKGNYPRALNLARTLQESSNDISEASALVELCKQRAKLIPLEKQSEDKLSDIRGALIKNQPLQAIESIGKHDWPHHLEEDYLSLLGAAKYQLGLYEEACQLFERVFKKNSRNAVATRNWAEALTKLERFEEAERILQKSLHLEPKNERSLNLMGILSEHKSESANARVYYNMAIENSANFPDAVHNLCMLTAREEGDQKALTMLDDFLVHFPNDTTLRLLRTELVNRDEKRSLAVNELDDLTRLPDISDVKSTVRLAKLYLNKKDLDKAIHLLVEALERHPNNYELNFEIAFVFSQARQPSAAIKHYMRALKANDNAALQNNLGLEFGKSAQPERALLHFEEALKQDPSLVQAYHNMCLYSHYSSELTKIEIAKIHEKYGNFAAERYPLIDDHPDLEVIKDDRICVGFVSPDFHHHAVAQFLLPLYRNLDHSQFKIISYYAGTIEDKKTKEFIAHSEIWRNIANVNDEKSCSQIRSDRVDILIDLAGHTDKNRLGIFARKPAPMQFSWLGYPNGTGLRTIDYRISDEVADPIGCGIEEDTENLIRLPDGAWCFDGDRDMEVVLEPPATQNGFITFGSFNNPAKMSKATLAIWSEILTKTKSSRLLLKGNGLEDPGLKQLLINEFDKQGVNPDRLEFLDRTASNSDHLNLYSRVDIGLDPFPYNGTTTTCEALWMGVPVVCLEGDTHVSRVGASLLSHLNLTNLLARSETDYVEIASTLGQNLDALKLLRRQLRPMLSASRLCNGELFTRNFEKALIEKARH